jgi:hypothetical protein
MNIYVPHDLLFLTVCDITSFCFYSMHISPVSLPVQVDGDVLRGVGGPHGGGCRGPSGGHGSAILTYSSLQQHHCVSGSQVSYCSACYRYDYLPLKLCDLAECVITHILKIN